MVNIQQTLNEWLKNNLWILIPSSIDNVYIGCNNRGEWSFSNESIYLLNLYKAHIILGSGSGNRDESWCVSMRFNYFAPSFKEKKQRKL
jgi:hypothetical protein